MRHIRIGSLLLACLFFVLNSASVFAQSGKTQTYLNQQRYLEEKIRLDIDSRLPANQKVLFDWGGWVSSYLFLFDDGENSSRTERKTDFRLWGSFNAENGIHRGYVRMRLSYNDFNYGDSYDGNDDDLEGPNLDVGWYRLDIAKAMKKYNGYNLPFGLAVKVGRDYTVFGTGYALSLPLDGVWIEGTVGDFSIDGLLARTIHSYDNIDTSRPNASRSWRCFSGVQVKYHGFTNHVPFFYYIWQRDRQGDGNPFLYAQQWKYDSQYLGLGSTGQISSDWGYSAELVYEHGKGYGDGQFFDRNPVDAYGWDMQLEYLPSWKTHPKFEFEYMFASGDSSRSLSPTDAVGGPTPFSKDSGFNGFGYRDTGLSLFPSLSNIHIWKMGASCFPFEGSRAEWLKKMEVGTNWFLYHKNRRKGAISDTLADVQSGYLGWEMDYYANWRFTSDLAWTVRYGAFFPGKAYSDRTTRTFFLTGLTWSF